MVYCIWNEAKKEEGEMNFSTIFGIYLFVCLFSLLKFHGKFRRNRTHELIHKYSSRFEFIVWMKMAYIRQCRKCERERGNPREWMLFDGNDEVQFKDNRFIEKWLYGSRSIAPFLHHTHTRTHTFSDCLVQQKEWLFWYQNYNNNNKTIYTLNFFL